MRSLRRLYTELSVTRPQIGVDDAMENPPELFEHEATRQGKRTLAQNNSLSAREYAKTGCPITLRSETWCRCESGELAGLKEKMNLTSLPI